MLIPTAPASTPLHFPPPYSLLHLFPHPNSLPCHPYSFPSSHSLPSSLLPSLIPLPSINPTPFPKPPCLPSSPLPFPVIPIPLPSSPLPFPVILTPHPSLIYTFHHTHSPSIIPTPIPHPECPSLILNALIPTYFSELLFDGDETGVNVLRLQH